MHCARTSLPGCPTPVAVRHPQPLDESEKSAGRTILRALRKSRLPVDRLKKDTEALACLRTPKFEKVVFSIAKDIYMRWKRNNEAGIVESPARQAEVRQSVEALKRKRVEYQRTNIIPVYTVKGPGEMPDYTMKPGHALPFIPACTIPVANPQELNSLRRHIPTRKELDEAVKKFATLKDVLPWDFGMDGCYARAQVMIQQLLLMGIPKENLGKAYLLFPIGENWTYHVTPIVKTDTGEWVSVDPAMDAEETSTIPDWADFMTPEGAPIPPSLGKPARPHFFYDPRIYSLLFVNADQSAVFNRYQGTGFIHPDNNLQIHKNLATLGMYRAHEIDIPFLNRFFGIA
jgi:hypothetical protein